mgnify:FL=1
MYAVLWERICPYLPDRASRWQSYPLIYEPFFILCDIKIHLDIPFSVRHALSPFFNKEFGIIPIKHSSFWDKEPENTKNRKRVFACCACHRSLTFYFPSTKYYNLENGKMAVSEKGNRKMPRLNLRYRVICRGIAL